MLMPGAAATRVHAPAQHSPFAGLVPAAAWAGLPDAVRARFSANADAVYCGRVSVSRMTRFGWLLGQVARLIGGPLPLSRDTGTPAMVAVTVDPVSDRQGWTRIYGRHERLPQVIQSMKSFSGPTGLEEHIGAGFGIALTVQAGPATLAFLSDHYFLALGRFRLKLPRLLSPGALTILHTETGPDRFRFTLLLDHPLLGRIFEQHADFEDAAS